MGQLISTAGDLQVERTSAAAEHIEIEEDPQINGRQRRKRIRRSAAVEHTEIEEDPPMEIYTPSLNPPSYLPSQESWMLPTFTGGMGLVSVPVPPKLSEHTESEEKIHWPENSIFRVPWHIKSGREYGFEPKLVSIGPYFLGRKELERMENLKIRCRKEILKMLGIALTKTNLAGNPHKLPEIFAVSRFPGLQVLSNNKLQEDVGIDDELFQKFMHLGTRARGYYKEQFNLTDVQFVRMLYLDSCFIIRTIFAFSQQTRSMSFLDVHIKAVRSDLLLLDNQIPLFFIKEVYKWFLEKLDKNSPNFETVQDFNAVLEPFICLDMPWAINQEARSSEAAHLLELYWRYSLPPQKYKELTSSENYPLETERDLSISSKIDPSKKNEPMVIANATELQQMAGIEFEKFKAEGHLAVTFSKAFFKGIIRMPRLKIDFRQMTLITNLIVFESCITSRMRTISCYMKLMDELINSEKDVELLQNSGIIYNTLKSHEEAATLFNDIGNFCFTNDDENLFSGLYTDVKKYDTPWHRRLASLRHNYFSSPWAFISFVAALILLFLSLVQTFYAVYGYHKPNN